MITAWKLFNQRKDGSIGPLFINRRQRIEPGVWYRAEKHPTKGFKERHGWHGTAQASAPHLSSKGRVWRQVMFDGVTVIRRPEHQGGKWYIAENMLVLG